MNIKEHQKKKKIVEKSIWKAHNDLLTFRK